MSSILIELAQDELVVRHGEELTRLDLAPEAPRAIELKVGENCIRIDARGITIQGLVVKIEGEVLAELKGGVQTQVKGDSLTSIQGGLTTIN